MSSPVQQVVTLGAAPWPTVDPFLFCVHHLDDYPAGGERNEPLASLEGRSLGSDFSGLDGWSMYHGEVVPGFPAHPHRGFETVTVVRRGIVDHADSLGAAARYGAGDVQWMTAGRGIVHAEMFPLLDRTAPNTLEMFQIWLNLPADRKMVEPHFTMMWSHDIPTVVLPDGGEVTVVAGSLGGVVAPPPPPASWAARPESEVAIWTAGLPPGGRWTLPAAPDGVVRVLYHPDGSALSVGSEHLDSGSAAVLGGDPADIVAGDTGAELLLLQGRPIGQPVAQYGPFVMNTEAEIREAFDDYRATEFGGWPWSSTDPVHGSEGRRFARHADGRLEEVPSSGEMS